MQLSDFDFDLPEHLIAQQPPAERGASRLLSALPGEPLRDEMFSVLPQLVGRGDVLVFNNTKVMKARLFGQKASGGKIEALIERVLDAHTALAHIRSSKSPKPGTRLLFDGGIGAEMTAREGELFRLHFDGEETVYRLLERHGRLPLPPYIERAADGDDESRYQTVYAKHQGAVAAPTAGLHFTDALLAELKAKGVRLAEVTLHVGAGTFQPVRTENIAEHKMHSEWYDVPPETVAAVEAAFAERYPGATLRWVGGTWAESASFAFFAPSHPRALPGVPDAMPALVNPHPMWAREHGAIFCTGTYGVGHDEACERQAEVWLTARGLVPQRQEIIYRAHGWRYPRPQEKLAVVYWVAPH